MDWSDINTIWLITGGFAGVFLLYNLIPGLYLGNEYYKYDKLAYNKIKKNPLHEFKKSINKVDCISSYTDGKWVPGAIHADYWYYDIYLKNEENYKVSNFLAVELNLFKYTDKEPNHVYTLFPSIKYEDDLTLKEKEKKFHPSKSLINRIQRRDQRQVDLNASIGLPCYNCGQLMLLPLAFLIVNKYNTNIF